MLISSPYVTVTYIDVAEDFLKDQIYDHLGKEFFLSHFSLFKYKK